MGVPILQEPRLRDALAESFRIAGRPLSFENAFREPPAGSGLSGPSRSRCSRCRVGSCARTRGVGRSCEATASTSREAATGTSASRRRARNASPSGSSIRRLKGYLLRAIILGRRRFLCFGCTSESSREGRSLHGHPPTRASLSFGVEARELPRQSSLASPTRVGSGASAGAIFFVPSRFHAAHLHPERPPRGPGAQRISYVHVPIWASCL
jgi:hypothetical protein